MGRWSKDDLGGIYLRERGRSPAVGVVLSSLSRSSLIIWTRGSCSTWTSAEVRSNLPGCFRPGVFLSSLCLVSRQDRDLLWGVNLLTSIPLCRIT